MGKSTKAMIFAAVAGLGLAGFAQAAPPIVELRLKLTQSSYTGDPAQDTDTGVELPKIGGDYFVTPGSHFFVEIGMLIDTGTENFTGNQALRSTVTRNKPLGIAGLSANILSPSSGMVVPFTDGSNWIAGAEDSDLTDDGFGVQATVSDQNGDGIPDVTGAGFDDPTLVSVVSTTSLLARLEYGVDPADGVVSGGDHGFPSFYERGEFVQSGGNLGADTLTAVFVTNDLYRDPGTNNSLTTVANDAGHEVIASVPIVSVIPEPTSLGVLSLFPLLFARRRFHENKTE